MNFNEIFEKLTDEEKIALVSGKDFMYTNGIPRLSVKSVSLSDGPHGLRKQMDEYDNGITLSEPSTAFPTASLSACSFNPEILRRMGEAIAEECKNYEVDLLLGPGTNIKRNPLCGRNFEYFSEDPYLAGKMSAAHINGVKSLGVGVSLKHFALNNSENYRFLGDSIADMRAMREVYLKPFEIAVKESAPDTLMCAYNKINGTFCSENKWLLTDVLRDEWGFEGAVMTDWGAMHNRAKALVAGLDLEMPGDTTVCRADIYKGLSNDSISSALDASAKRILTLAERFENNEKTDADFDAHHELAARIAEDSAVLLKNDGILPLNSADSFAVIGELFDKMRYQGAGSSMINATKVTSPKLAFDERGIKYTYAQGYRENTTEVDEALISQALKTASEFDKVLLFIGLTDNTETEGCDRESMKLPENQVKLVEKILELHKKVIIVLFGGSPVELPFADKASAILNMYLPGQNGGTATANILFGNVNPSGRLAETWVKRYPDIPNGDTYSKEEREIYKEGIYVGYRYQISHRDNIRYPFGYGLSYTGFEYSDLRISSAGGEISITVTVTNTGDVFGGEVIQLYSSKPDGAVARPVRELRAFDKVYLAPGEKREVTLNVPVSDLAVYSIIKSRYIVENGEYVFEIAKDSVTPVLSGVVNVSGEVLECESYPAPEAIVGMTDAQFEEFSGVKIPEQKPKLPLTMESRFTDFKLTFFGRLIYNAVLSMPKSQLKAAKKLPEGIERENRIKGAIFLKHMLDSNTPNSMAMSAGKTVSYNLAEALVHLGNGKIFKALGAIFRRIKAPKLPKQ